VLQPFWISDFGFGICLVIGAWSLVIRLSQRAEVFLQEHFQITPVQVRFLDEL
jgi:hypothetical protein